MQKIGMNPVSFKGILVHNCSKQEALKTIQSSPPFSKCSEEFLDNAMHFEKQGNSVELSTNPEIYEEFEYHHSEEGMDKGDIDHHIRHTEAIYNAKWSLMFERKGKKCEYTGEHRDLFNIYKGIFYPNGGKEWK